LALFFWLPNFHVLKVWKMHFFLCN
jgi:hypothetical protein